MTRPGKTAGVLALLAALLVGSPALAQPDESTEAQLRDLKYRMERLERALREAKATYNADLQKLYDKLSDIERRLPGPRESLRPPNGSLTPTGRVRLDNRMPVTATWTIDGVSYSVSPFSTRTILRPLGSLSYSLTAEGSFGSTDRQTTVPATVTRVLIAYPR